MLASLSAVQGHYFLPPDLGDRVTCARVHRGVDIREGRLLRMLASVRRDSPGPGVTQPADSALRRQLPVCSPEAEVRRV